MEGCGTVLAHPRYLQVSEVVTHDSLSFSVYYLSPKMSVCVLFENTDIKYEEKYLFLSVFTPLFLL